MYLTDREIHGFPKYIPFVFAPNTTIIVINDKKYVHKLQVPEHNNRPSYCSNHWVYSLHSFPGNLFEPFFHGAYFHLPLLNFPAYL